MPQTFEYLDKMQERVIRFVTKHSKVTEDRFKELMFAKGNLTRDIGTNVIGGDAVKYGLIDDVGGIGNAIRKLNELIDNRADDHAEGQCYNDFIYNYARATRVSSRLFAM